MDLLEGVSFEQNPNSLVLRPLVPGLEQPRIGLLALLTAGFEDSAETRLRMPSEVTGQPEFKGVDSSYSQPRSARLNASTLYFA